MVLPNRDHQSQNFNSRRGTPIDMIIIHYTDMLDCAAAIARLCDAKAEVSTHYIICKTGIIYGLVDEEHRAWHAGVSAWQGASNINDRSIGIELDYPGHSHSEAGNLPHYPNIQIKALMDLINDIRTRHSIPTDHILGHEHIAPKRKIDPGPMFPWSEIRGEYSP